MSVQEEITGSGDAIKVIIDRYKGLNLVCVILTSPECYISFTVDMDIYDKKGKEIIETLKSALKSIKESAKEAE